jgi:hypothetical protein
MFFLPLLNPSQLLSHSIFGFKTFALVVNYINKMWVPCHNTIGIYEVRKRSKTTMVFQIKYLLNHFDLFNKVIAYVKDEIPNLNTITNALTTIVSYVSLMLPPLYVGNCYGHVMSKCCQHVINNLKVFNLTKNVCVFMQKNYYMDKKRQEGKAWMGKSLHRCISSPLEAKDSYENLICVQSHCFQRDYGVEKCNYLCYLKQKFSLQSIIANSHT